MKTLYVVAGALAVAACGKEPISADAERPEPPKFVASGNAPTPAVAIDFIEKYSAAAQAAIERTPYRVKDRTEQSSAAQALYKVDGDYLMRWQEAGTALFAAAGDQTCQLYAKAVFAAWREAYPLNGPPIEAEVKKKREYADAAKQLQGYCLSHTKLPSWGTGGR